MPGMLSYRRSHCLAPNARIWLPTHREEFHRRWWAGPGLLRTITSSVYVGGSKQRPAPSRSQLRQPQLRQSRSPDHSWSHLVAIILFVLSFGVEPVPLRKSYTCMISFPRTAYLLTCLSRIWTILVPHGLVEARVSTAPQSNSFHHYLARSSPKKACCTQNRFGRRSALPGASRALRESALIGVDGLIEQFYCIYHRAWNQPETASSSFINESINQPLCSPHFDIRV